MAVNIDHIAAQLKAEAEGGGTVQAAPAPSQPNQTILEEAASIIDGARRNTYGDEKESFNRIAGLFSAYLGIPITAQDVAALMILLKTSRAKNGYHRDSFVDIAGYAALTERLA